MFVVKTAYIPSRERLERIIKNMKIRRRQVQAQERASTTTIDRKVTLVRSD